MAARPDTVRIEFKSRMDVLEAIQAFVDKMAAIAGLDDDGIHDLSVSVRECVVNALKHGNKFDPEKLVTVDFALRPDEVEVWIQDRGAGFDLAKVPDATDPANILNSDGRGIFFMRAYTNEVEHMFPEEGGTIVRLLKKIDKKA